MIFNWYCIPTFHIESSCLQHSFQQCLTSLTSFLLGIFQAFLSFPFKYFLHVLLSFSLYWLIFWYDSMAVYKNLKMIGGVLSEELLFGGGTSMLSHETWSWRVWGVIMMSSCISLICPEKASTNSFPQVPCGFTFSCAYIAVPALEAFYNENIVLFSLHVLFV